MTTSSRPSAATRVRATMPLSKPYRQHQASLSFDAALALAYGLRAIGTANPQRPHESSITRRALEMYARLLSGMNADQLRVEGSAVAASSKALGLSADEQQAAFARLDAVAMGIPLPGFLEMRNGPSWVQMDAEALAARVDGMVNGMCRSSFTRKTVAS